MTERTKGKSLNYKLFGTKGVREVVSRESRRQEERAPLLEQSNSSSNSSDHSDHSESVEDVAAEFAALSLSARSVEESIPSSSIESPVEETSNQELVSVASSSSTPSVVRDCLKIESLVTHSNKATSNKS